MARNLLEAIFSGDERLARDILTRGTYANIDFRLPTQPGTALFCSCVRGYLPLVRLLLSYGADVNAQNENEATPLHGAVDNGHLDIARVLLQHGATVNARTQRGDSPLHLAAYRGFLYIAHDLLIAGADVTATNSRTMTPEMEAAGQGHASFVNFLKAVKQAQYPGSSDKSCQNSSVVILDPPQSVLTERNQNKERQHQAQFTHVNPQHLTKKQKRKEVKKNSDLPLSPPVAEMFQRTISPGSSLGLESFNAQKDSLSSTYMPCTSCLNCQSQRNQSASASPSKFGFGLCSCQKNLCAAGSIAGGCSSGGGLPKGGARGQEHDMAYGFSSSVYGQETRRSPVESDDSDDLSTSRLPSGDLSVWQLQEQFFKYNAESENNSKGVATAEKFAQTNRPPNNVQAQSRQFSQAVEYPNVESVQYPKPPQDSKYAHVQKNFLKDSSQMHLIPNQTVTSQASPMAFLLSPPPVDCDDRLIESKNSIEHTSPHLRDYTVYRHHHNKAEAKQVACLPQTIPSGFQPTNSLKADPTDFYCQPYKNQGSKMLSSNNKRRTSVGSIESAYSDSSSGGGSRNDVASIVVNLESGSDVSSMFLSDVSEVGDNTLDLPSCYPPPFYPVLDSQRCHSYPVLRDVHRYIRSPSVDVQSGTMKCNTVSGIYSIDDGKSETWLSNFVPSGPPIDHLDLCSRGTKEIPMRSMSTTNYPTQLSMPAARDQQPSAFVKHNLDCGNVSISLRRDTSGLSGPIIRSVGLHNDSACRSRSERCVSVDAGIAYSDPRVKKAIYRTRSANETSQRGNDMCRTNIDVPVNPNVSFGPVYDKVKIDSASLVGDSLEDIRERNQGYSTARSNYNSASDYGSGNPSLSSMNSEETFLPSINLSGVDDSGTHSRSMPGSRSDLAHGQSGVTSSLLHCSKFPRVTRVNSCPINNSPALSTAGEIAYFSSQKCSSSNDFTNIDNSSSSSDRSSSTEKNSNQGSLDTDISKLTSSDNSTYSADFSNETTSSSLNDLSRLSPLPHMSQGSDSGIPLPPLNSHQSMPPALTCINIPFQ